MARKILANVTHRQTRVAILDDGRVSELMVERGEHVVGNIYKGRVENIVRGLDAAFVECGLDKNVFIHVSDALPEEPPRHKMRHKMNSFPPIGDVVKQGQELLVQISKGPVEDKGARGTCRPSLPGRYLVLMPDTSEKVGVSKKIEDETERKRLRDLAQGVRPENFGIIVRTRAQGATKKEFQDDIRFLTRLWRSIQARARQAKAPALVHEDLSLVLEVIRDVFSADVSEFIIDDKVTYDKVLNLLDNVAPQLRDRVRLYREPDPIFAHYDVETQIDRALQPKVWLPHGGWLSIEQTEALTTIDVNTGKFSGKSLEDTVLRTNVEAAEEIAWQLRLRDVGGIIVIDFIDMDKPKHRKQVTTALRKAFEQDRMKTRILHITPLGLIEMTRKRTSESLAQKLQTTCPCCNGRGRILSAETVAANIEREIRTLLRETDHTMVHVVASPEVVIALIGTQGELVDQVETELQCQIYARCDAGIHPEHFQVTPLESKRQAAKLVLHKASQRLKVLPEDFISVSGSGLVASIEGLPVFVPEVAADTDEPVQVRLTKVANSYARGTPVKK